MCIRDSMKLAEHLFHNGKSFSGGWNFGPSSYENYSVGDVVNVAIGQKTELFPTL